MKRVYFNQEPEKVEYIPHDGVADVYLRKDIHQEVWEPATEPPYESSDYVDSEPNTMGQTTEEDVLSSDLSSQDQHLEETSPSENLIADEEVDDNNNNTSGDVIEPEDKSETDDSIVEDSANADESSMEDSLELQEQASETKNDATTEFSAVLEVSPQVVTTEPQTQTYWVANEIQIYGTNSPKEDYINHLLKKKMIEVGKYLIEIITKESLT